MTVIFQLFSENESQYGIKNTILDKQNPAGEEEGMVSRYLLGNKC